jgi:hypothetical protein
VVKICTNNQKTKINRESYIHLFCVRQSNNSGGRERSAKACRDTQYLLCCESSEAKEILLQAVNRHKLLNDDGDDGHGFMRFAF